MRVEKAKDKKKEGKLLKLQIKEILSRIFYLREIIMINLNQKKVRMTAELNRNDKKLMKIMNIKKLPITEISKMTKLARNYQEMKS